MTAITTQNIAGAVTGAKAAMGDLEQVLNEADSKLGDGDTGSMLARLIDRMADADPAAEPSISDAFSKLARAAMAATGSSLGTLFATGLMTASRMTKGRESIGWSELAPLLSASRDAMMARGGAKLGDKTVLDAIHEVAIAVEGLNDQASVAQSAKQAGQIVLERFFNESCKAGRARMFTERSIGTHDPGMLAFVRLVDAVAG
jgi:phosphoenolpyruvate---glycerone phosphotransferase subunit DhaL